MGTKLNFKLKAIATNYIKSFFIFDFISVVPVLVAQITMIFFY